MNKMTEIRRNIKALEKLRTVKVKPKIDENNRNM